MKKNPRVATQRVFNKRKSPAPKNGDARFLLFHLNDIFAIQTRNVKQKFKTSGKIRRLSFMGKPIKKSRGYWIFRASITLKNGIKIFAKDYGKKAFRIWIAF